MSACTTCNAQFGAKFTQYVCSICDRNFCSAHLIEAKDIVLDSSIQAEIVLKDGLCHHCIFKLWGKADDDLCAPKGIWGRLCVSMKVLWGKSKSLFSAAAEKTALVKISEGAFEKMNSNIALAVFRHQKDIGLDFIVRELTNFARLYSVSHGRKNEKDFSLKDVYRLVDWLKTHPTLPGWSHDITWDLLESGPSGISYLTDIWHVVGTAVSLSNPISAAYHVGDRVIEQTTGRGIFENLYINTKDKLGLNVNPKMAIVSYLSGLFILQLFKEQSNEA
jgi:hypothetical protein